MHYFVIIINEDKGRLIKIRKSYKKEEYRKGEDYKLNYKFQKKISKNIQSNNNKKN